jgi:hypothetical protein
MRKLLLLIIFLLLSGSLLRSQTSFEGAGIYDSLLADLKKNLYGERNVKKVMLDGKERLMFISWVRDHIHTMKAYKYWEKDLGSYLDFYMGRQTEKGMYFDYWDSYKNKNVGQLFFTNCFDRQFYFVDVNNQNFFFRMPMEADLEYLMVEGVHTYWQTSGDTSYLKKWLPVLTKGMKYEMTDPLRWSSEHLLVKRPYTIDTWDFTSQPDSLKDVPKLLGHIDNTIETPKGIMHGDNSGMFRACMQLSAMFAATGNRDAAAEWSLQGGLFLQRLNTTCWNGKFYSHFIPEDPVPSHIKTDPINSIGLSNTYTINRGATTLSMAASIIRYYMEIGEKTKSADIAPWYGIYPFIYPHFGNYKVGEYMNGAVLPLVGGELCKAAFQNGFEKYAVEQLQILGKILKLNNGRLPGCANGNGTAQKEAIPDEWGTAAFVSAMVEGLAGVVDKGIMFEEVEISPRWYFAGINQTNVNIGYGNDGNNVKYNYLFNPKNNNLEITTDGRFKKFTLRVPLPGNIRNATAELNGKNAAVRIENVNNSKYAVVKGSGNTNKVLFTFR